MNKPQHFVRRGLFAAFAVLLGACTTQSGPMHTVRAIKAPGQPMPVFRVTCEGLLSSTNSCDAAAREFCAGKPVTLLEAVDRVRRGAAMDDPRELTFVCGVPPQPRVEPPAAVQPQPVEQPQPTVAPIAQREVLLQGSANFEFDSAVLTPSAGQELNRFLDVNRGVQFRRVTVTGYTDSQGTRAYNVRLSEVRARAVAAYLRTGGLRSEHVVTIGKGAAEPVASNATADGRAQNRRVEIELEGR